MCFDDKTFHTLVGCLYFAGGMGADKALLSFAVAAAYLAAAAWCRH
ncbi:MAG: hypothetical protein AAF677_14815 [Pseudomonadota bacterium]